MRRCIYTVLTNNYDTLRQQLVRPNGFDFICFTDNPNLQVPGWKMRYIEPAENPIKQQREIKIRPHVFLPGYNFTVYHDASTQLKRDVSYVVKNYFRGGMLLKVHPTRKCIYSEAVEIVKLGKDTVGRIARQVEAYTAEGMPKNYGLYETGILFRENRPDVNAVMDAWWKEVEQYSHRDQMSLTPVLWRMNYTPSKLAASFIGSFITIHKHNGTQTQTGPTKPPVIRYSNPWNSEKNIGKALNEFCAEQANDSWICLQDGDIMYLTDFWGKQVEDIVKQHGHYDLIGCLTNRLASPHQCYNGELSENTDLLYHMDIAERLFKDHYSQVEHINRGIAGMFMLFPKKTWLKHKFRENTNAFDTYFSKEVLKAGGKIGLAKGLYVFHKYRLNKPNPTKNIDHLLQSAK